MSGDAADRPDRRWVVLGWGLSLLWIAFVLLYSQGEASHPLFDLIFLVPLGGWIAGFAIARARHARRARGTAAADRPEA